MQVRLVCHLFALVGRGLIVDVDLGASAKQLNGSVAVLVVSAHLGKGDGANSQQQLVPVIDAADSLGLSLWREGEAPWLCRCVTHDGLEVQ